MSGSIVDRDLSVLREPDPERIHPTCFEIQLSVALAEPVAHIN